MCIFLFQFSAEFPIMSNKAGDGYLVSPVKVDYGVDFLHVDIDGILSTGSAGLQSMWSRPRTF